MNKRNRKIHSLRANFVVKLAKQLQGILFKEVDYLSKPEVSAYCAWYRQHLINPAQAGHEVSKMKPSLLNRVYALMQQKCLKDDDGTMFRPWGGRFQEKFCMTTMAAKRQRSRNALNSSYYEVARAALELWTATYLKSTCH